jgi:hypothetical protein
MRCLHAATIHVFALFAVVGFHATVMQVRQTPMPTGVSGHTPVAAGPESEFLP